MPSGSFGSPGPTNPGGSVTLPGGKNPPGFSRLGSCFGRSRVGNDIMVLTLSLLLPRRRVGNSGPPLKGPEAGCEEVDESRFRRELNGAAQMRIRAHDDTGKPTRISI